MGRALYSTKYAPVVTVRTEPEVVERWSVDKPFDPESEEFNRDAQREVFIDTEAYRQEQQAVLAALAAEGGTESSASSDTSDNDHGSPMAVGSDDPALLIANAYANVDWEPRWIVAANDAAADWSDRRGSVSEGAREQIRPLRVSRPRSSTVSSGHGFLPPSSLRNSTTATDMDGIDSDMSPQSPTARRVITVTPIRIPNEPSSPSPVSPLSPSTPTDTVDFREIRSLLTPSPPPTVTPHIYTWRRVPLGVQTSPLASHSNPAGLLTNPSARLSLPRINFTPARVRIQNTVV